jgi:hypothetical protein
MQVMLFGAPPEFRDILDELKHLEAEINATAQKTTRASGFPQQYTSHGLNKPLLLTRFCAISLVSACESRVSYVSIREGQRHLLGRR